MPDLTIIKILLIEDSPTDARLLQHSLQEVQNESFEITWVERMKDAIDQLRANTFDVALLDLTLPDSSGIGSISRIQEAAQNLAIVVLTGIMDETAGSHAIRLGVQEYLIKGTVDGTSVGRAIRYAIERKRAGEDLRNLNSELQAVNKSLSDSRRAALNMMDDAIAARKQAEETTLRLEFEIAERQKKEAKLHKLTRTLAALGHSSKSMMRAKNEQEYLSDICKIIVEDCGYVLVSIGFTLNDENKSVLPVANSGFEDGYLETAHVSWADNERGRGPTGTAIRTGTIQFCTNMQTDPKFLPWRSEAIKRGFKSSIAIPLIANGTAFGALAIYSQDADPFIESEVALLSELGDDLSYGIMAMRLRNELTLREEQLQHRAEQLSIANKELESFSYSVSHDLRAPIRAIKGFSSILLEDYADKLDKQGQDFLARIMHGTDRMTELIDDMLWLAKISLQEMKPEEINLNELAVPIISELQQADPHRVVEVVLRHELHAYGDARLLIIALSNLIGNAWKYSSKTPNARIEFGCREQNSEKVFFVRDNGAGFDMTHSNKLFAPFQRLHSESQFPGTGIGLAIVNKVIQRHGGRIWGESEVGKGATFYFTTSIDKQAKQAKGR